MEGGRRLRGGKGKRWKEREGKEGWGGKKVGRPIHLALSDEIFSKDLHRTMQVKAF